MAPKDTITIDYIDLILRVLAYCGVALVIGGGIAWLRGERKVAPTLVAIGVVCLVPQVGAETWGASKGPIDVRSLEALPILAAIGVLLIVAGGVAWLRSEHQTASGALAAGAICVIPLIVVALHPRYSAQIILWLYWTVAYLWMSSAQAAKEKRRSLLFAFWGLLLVGSFLIPDARWSSYALIAASAVLFVALIVLQIGINRDKRLTHPSL